MIATEFRWLSLYTLVNYLLVGDAAFLTVDILKSHNL